MAEMTNEEKLRDLDKRAWELINKFAELPRDCGWSCGWSGPPGWRDSRAIAIQLVKYRRLATARWEVQVSHDMGARWSGAFDSGTYDCRQDAVNAACGWAVSVHPNNYKIYRVVRAEGED